MMRLYSTFNREALETHVIIDESGMAVINGDPESARDAAWRTAAAYKAWDYFHLYSAPIYKCTRFVDGETHYRRHPKYNFGSDMSRDHVTALLLLAYFGFQNAAPGALPRLKRMIDTTKWRIGPNATFTIDMWCWMKGIFSRPWRTLFYIIEIPLLAWAAWWNAQLLEKGNFTVPEYAQRSFVYSGVNLNVTEDQELLRKQMYPYYALTGLAWQNYINPNSIGKRILSRIIRNMCGAHNYLVRLLTDDMTVTKDQVLGWVEMTGAPFSVLMNEATSRDIRFLTEKEGEYNWLYADLLITIWNEKHPEDKIFERIIL